MLVLILSPCCIAICLPFQITCQAVEHRHHLPQVGFGDRRMQQRHSLDQIRIRGQLRARVLGRQQESAVIQVREAAVAFRDVDGQTRGQLIHSPDVTRARVCP